MAKSKSEAKYTLPKNYDALSEEEKRRCLARKYRQLQKTGQIPPRKTNRQLIDDDHDGKRLQQLMVAHGVLNAEAFQLAANLLRAVDLMGRTKRIRAGQLSARACFEAHRDRIERAIGRAIFSRFTMQISRKGVSHLRKKEGKLIE